MSNEFEGFEKAPVPTLVFDAAPQSETGAKVSEAIDEVAKRAEAEAIAETQAASAAAAAAAGAAAAEPAVSDDVLSDEEKQQVDAFAKQIDVTNSTAVLQYGAGAQKKMADFSEKALENVRTKDMGEVGNMIAGLVTELKSFDVEENEKGFLGLFKKNVNKLGVMKAKYDEAEVNVGKITKALEDHQVQLIKDIAVLDKMYDRNSRCISSRERSVSRMSVKGS